MYDVIIVGAGTAGCVLAERLTRNGRLHVLLIEAGGAPSSQFVRIPAGFARLFKSKYDWSMQSEPQATAGGRSIFIPRGKMLGGSANMNAQIHQWCHPADFNDWVSAGAFGWSWDDVAPVFRSQENWSGEKGQTERGHSGPMHISPNRYAHRLSHAFVESVRNAGFGLQTHYNGGPYEGAWIAELAHKNGQRYSVYDAYLKVAQNRTNLKVMKDAQVLQIIIKNSKAIGVTVYHQNNEMSVTSRTVVLAAGAFGSPQLLMLSGIGPGSVLQSFGIPVQYEAPDVGKNLQDHPIAPLVFKVKGNDSFKNAESIPNLLRYVLFKKGMLASNAIEAIAFTSSDKSRSTAPDIELICAPFEWRNEGLEPPQLHAVCLGAVVASPRSRGHVTLKSTSAFDQPAIDFQLLGDPEGQDREVFLNAVRLVRKVAATRPLADLIAGEWFPGDSVNTDDELLEVLGQRLQTVYHPSSTCRMGSDSQSVVDTRLRVRGIEGLWIADASIMPSVPRGHPNAVVAMIAYRAADWIAASLLESKITTIHGLNQSQSA